MNVLKIELGDSDAFLHGGTPSLVVVHVVLDNGKRITFPYQASQPIASLYKAVSQALGFAETTFLNPELPPMHDFAETVSTLAGDELEENSELESGKNEKEPPLKDRAKSIERRDYIRFVGITDKDSPAELVTGRQYRVLERILQNGKLIGYGMVDDESKNRIRLDVPANTVELVKKAGPKQKKKIGPKELIHKCPECEEDNALVLEGDKFVGVCDCGAALEAPREVKAKK